ncbi:MAG: hypothetical protein II010_03365 [Oscillospiraceae bacterium]|nr:hypothetical protein [Oscillospiraceae bacterium]
MYEFTVPMALVDYIPVLLFGAAAVLLQRDLYNKMPKYAFACFAAGTINIFIAGFLKATWKLLYALGACDFQALNAMFLPTQSIGFLLAGLGVVLMLTGRKRRVLAAAPPVFGGTMLFISIMVLGLGAICSGLSVVAVRMKKSSAALLFILSFLCSMGMGYLSSRDAASAAVNWIEQSVNCVGQGAMLLGALTLHRAGLRDYQL